MRIYIITLLCLVVLNVLLYNKMVEAKPKYTHEEEDAITKFRELVKDDLYKDYMKSDAYLIRWLRAKGFNQNDAAFMIRKALNWRKDNKIDGIIDETIYEGARAFFTDGIDNDGSVVATAHTTRFETRSFVVAGKRSVPIRQWSQMFEMVEQNILRNLGVIGNNTLEGDATDLVTLIINLHGYNLRQHACLSCFCIHFEFFDIMENFYASYLKHLIFINTPRIFDPLLALLKPLLSTQSRSGFKVFRNRTEWEPAIIGKIVPPDQVRTEFGGTKPE